MKRCTRREWICFFNKLSIDSNNCWNFTGTPSQRYGLMSFKGKYCSTHRFSYTQLKGSIPTKYVIDHICRNTRCANPEHLRVVTQKQNSLENSNGISAKNSIATYCKHGHEFSKENTITIHRNDGRVERLCRSCHKKSNNSYARGEKNVY